MPNVRAATDNAPFWYSFDYGSVHFVVISTEHDVSPGSTQYRWAVGACITAVQGHSAGMASWHRRVGQGITELCHGGLLAWALCWTNECMALLPALMHALIHSCWHMLCRWLAADLAAVDRCKTPWVVLGMHRPMYVVFPHKVCERPMALHSMGDCSRAVVGHHALAPLSTNVLGQPHM